MWTDLWFNRNKQAGVFHIESQIQFHVWLTVWTSKNSCNSIVFRKHIWLNMKSGPNQSIRCSTCQDNHTSFFYFNYIHPHMKTCQDVSSIHNIYDTTLISFSASQSQTWLWKQISCKCWQVENYRNPRAWWDTTVNSL